MFKILGLSHLVFTVNTDKINSLNETLLGSFYGDGDYLEFNHQEARKDIIRNNTNSISKISLFKPLQGNLPAIEFLYSKNTLSRHINTYGLIFNNHEFKCNQLEYIINFDKHYYAKCFFDPKLNLYISYSTNLIQDQFGCWIIVKDFDQQKQFFLNEKSNQVISCDQDKLVIKCRVINSKFSSYTIVLLKDNSLLNENYYNDDLGLSTIGWFQKSNSEVKPTTIFFSTIAFQILIFKRKFEAKFFYNNVSISHELLNVQ